MNSTDEYETLSFYNPVPLGRPDVTRIQTEYRIPVDSRYPRKQWIACLAADSDLPDNRELSQLRSYIEYRCQGFYGGASGNRWGRIMLGDPSEPDDYRTNQHLARIEGHNTVAFTKHDGGWFFRRSTWQHGVIPWRHLDDYTPVSLEELLDQHPCSELATDHRVPAGPPHHGFRRTIDGKWLIWKNAHADLFTVLRPPIPATYSSDEVHIARLLLKVADSVNDTEEPANHLTVLTNADITRMLRDVLPAQYLTQTRELNLQCGKHLVRCRTVTTDDDTVTITGPSGSWYTLLLPADLDETGEEIYQQLRRDGCTIDAAAVTARNLQHMDNRKQ